MKKRITKDKLNTSSQESQVQTYPGDMWKMLFICGIPLIGLLAIGISAVSIPSLEFIFLLICAIGMIGMMVIMHRDRNGREKSYVGNETEKGANHETGK